MSGDGTAGGIRLDKWLWQARFFKSRSLATRICAGGKVRVDGVAVRKPHFIVRVGTVLTFAQAREIRVVRIEALGERRGPASEARTLYTEITASIGETAAEDDG